MSLQTNYIVPIHHPTTDLHVDAVVSFYYEKGWPESWDEPGSNDSVEINTCTVDGEDVLSLMSDYQVSGIESVLLSAAGEYDGPDTIDNWPEGYSDEY